MINRCELLGDVLFIASGFEGVVSELFAVVIEKDTGEAEVANNVLPDKFKDVAASDGGQRFCLNIFGEVVYNNDQESKMA